MRSRTRVRAEPHQNPVQNTSVRRPCISLSSRMCRNRPEAKARAAVSKYGHVRRLWIILVHFLPSGARRALRRNAQCRSKSQFPHFFWRLGDRELNVRLRIRYRNPTQSSSGSSIPSPVRKCSRLNIRRRRRKWWAEKTDNSRCHVRSLPIVDRWMCPPGHGEVLALQCSTRHAVRVPIFKVTVAWLVEAWRATQKYNKVK